MIKYKVSEKPVVYLGGRKPELTTEVFILRCSSENNKTWVPSPLTYFLYHKYTANSCSNNTKMPSALTICNFLNYLNEQTRLDEDPCFRNLKDEGLYSIEFLHLAKFLNYISQKSEIKNSYKTVKKKEYYLLSFYKYLHDNGITGSNTKVITRTDKYGNEIIISPFDEDDTITIHYPSKNNKSSRVLKDMETDVWNRFLDYAEEHYPNIALGVAFQFMGGLRRGEVVNLIINAIEPHKDKQHIRLHVADRQKELFLDRKVDLRKCQVKQERINQPVFNFNGELFKLLDKHLKNLANNTKVKNKQALFVDSQGHPMSGDSYNYYFTNLKADFIDFLDNKGYQKVVNTLNNSEWASHIGRHVFTNYLIKIGAVSDANGDPVSKYLMSLRGDKSEKSSAEYIDTKTVIDVVVDKIDLISQVANKISV